ncbi:MAG: class I SAM-dependent methyltransferase [Candidatus Marsarchaeota archaeon]|jgi:SAM-dependent methyltransferase|nr:class I SAM-dependent methyltransferase [Candidatus Marsarchaeota archaeon]
MVTKDSPRNILLKKRLTEALLDTEVIGAIQEDFVSAFENIGLSEAGAKRLTRQIIANMRAGTTLKTAEDNVRTLFDKIEIDGKPFMEVLHQKLEEREDRIAGELGPYVKGIKGKVIDFGAGSGGIAQRLHDRYGLDMEMVDVSNFRDKSVTVPSLEFEGGRVPAADGRYNAAVLSVVIHHEADNERILRELTRIVKHRIVIIETSPADGTKQQWERTFVNDALWNRFFQNADIPVPGTYESPDGWIRRFGKHGWRVKHEVFLGYNELTTKLIHNLLVFEKK